MAITASVLESDLTYKVTLTVTSDLVGDMAAGWEWRGGSDIQKLLRGWYSAICSLVDIVGCLPRYLSR